MTERFDGEFYISTLSRMLSRKPKGYKTQEMMRRYLVEMGTTRQALVDLGVGFDDHPGKIADIDTVVNQQEIGGIKVVEFTGSPGTGKSVLTRALAANSDENIFVIPEAYEIARKSGMLMSENYAANAGAVSLVAEELFEIGYKLASMQLDSQERKRHQTLLDSANFVDLLEISEELEAVKVDQSANGALLVDRYLDKSFNRAQFLTGRIGFQEFQITKMAFDLTLNFLLDQKVRSPNAVFMMLATPDQSIQRKGRVGDLMNEEFLGVLYTQHIRRYWELMNLGYENLVLFDATCSEEEALGKMDTLCSEITGVNLAR